MGLPYPGGPQIEKHAQNGIKNKFKLPRAMKNQGLEFSFSGLKTAVRDLVSSVELSDQSISDICLEFQQSVADILSIKAIRACHENNCKDLIFCGGVAANKFIISHLETTCKSENINFYVPEFFLCTDNAAMIASAAHFVSNNR